MEYKWSISSVNENKKKTICLLIFLILVFIGVYSFYGFIWFLVSFVFLIGSLSSYFVRTYYIFTDNHIEIKSFLSHLKKEWSYYRSYYEDKNGIFLSPFGKPSRLENFRGIYIRFGIGDRALIRKIIKNKIEINLRESSEKQK